MKYLIIYLWICLIAHFGGDIFYLRSDKKLYKNGWHPDYSYAPLDAILDMLLSVTPIGLVLSVAMIKAVVIARGHSCEEMNNEVTVRSFFHHFTFKNNGGLL